MMMNRKKISSTGGWRRTQSDKDDFCLTDTVSKMENHKVTLTTGKKCTESGEWEIEGRISTVVYISKGEVMPTYCGKNVKWILVRKG